MAMRSTGSPLNQVVRDQYASTLMSASQHSTTGFAPRDTGRPITTTLSKPVTGFECGGASRSTPPNVREALFIEAVLEECFTNELIRADIDPAINGACSTGDRMSVFEKRDE